LEGVKMVSGGVHEMNQIKATKTMKLEVETLTPL